MSRQPASFATASPSPKPWARPAIGPSWWASTMAATIPWILGSNATLGCAAGRRIISIRGSPRGPANPNRRARPTWRQTGAGGVSTGSACKAMCRSTRTSTPPTPIRTGRSTFWRNTRGRHRPSSSTSPTKRPTIRSRLGRPTSSATWNATRRATPQSPMPGTGACLRPASSMAATLARRQPSGIGAS